MIQFSSHAIFDPVRMTGESPPNARSRGRVYVNLVFNASPADAGRLEEQINALFAESRSADAGDVARERHRK